MNDRSKVAVLIPAAGHGARMGGTPKQFRLLGGSTILLRTLGVFESHPLIDSLAVAVHSDAVEGLADALRRKGIHKTFDVVAGGSSRQESVAAALAVLPDTVDVVLVHDAVRPFLPSGRITAVIEAVREHGAAALAVPLTDTLRRGERGLFGHTIDRSGLYCMQTPQGFRRDWFEDAHERARQGGYSETDDVALVQRLGRDVKIVEGTSSNIKITTPADWALAKALWESEQAEIS